MKGKKTDHYHAYLLRIWRDDEYSPWRLQLENPHTGEKLGFSSIEKMKSYLENWLLNNSEILEDTA